LQQRASDVLEAAVVGLAGDLLKYVLVAVIGVVALAIWRGGSVPSWLAIAVVVGALAIAFVLGRRLRRRIGALQFETQDLADALSRHDAYTSHVAEVLDSLQRVIAGDLGASIEDYIERGILEPARAYLMSEPGDDVRLSILIPRAGVPSRWEIAFSAGHSLAGREKYAEPIITTLSRYAFETGRAQAWGDVRQERGFTPTPLATRPFASMISMPILSGDDVVGVFNVISAEPYAFDPAEERYIASLGGVINVAVGLLIKNSPDAPDHSD
jgi:GAF domain-containing protein